MKHKTRTERVYNETTGWYETREVELKGYTFTDDDRILIVRVTGGHVTGGQARCVMSLRSPQNFDFADYCQQKTSARGGKAQSRCNYL